MRLIFGLYECLLVGLVMMDEKGVRHVMDTCCMSSAILFLTLVFRVKI
jgi:hypothetical protein